MVSILSTEGSLNFLLGSASEKLSKGALQGFGLFFGVGAVVPRLVGSTDAGTDVSAAVVVGSAGGLVVPCNVVRG